MSIGLRVGRVLIAAATVALVMTASKIAFASGDPARGQTFYAVCSTCHGPQGEGMKEMNAPALAGREEWYLVRQIQNFKAGIRGGHPEDVYGRQMAPMAAILPDIQAIEDVAAYLHSLGR